MLAVAAYERRHFRAALNLIDGALKFHPHIEDWQNLRRAVIYELDDRFAA